jgi:hypothetical protein
MRQEGRLSGELMKTMFHLAGKLIFSSPVWRVSQKEERPRSDLYYFLINRRQLNMLYPAQIGGTPPLLMVFLLPVS